MIIKQNMDYGDACTLALYLTREAIEIGDSGQYRAAIGENGWTVVLIRELTLVAC